MRCHPKIILRLEQSTVDGTGISQDYDILRPWGILWPYALWVVDWVTPLTVHRRGAKTCRHTGLPQVMVLLRASRGPAIEVV
jgi:hypothetical protein